MARKKKTSLWEDSFDIASNISWKISLAIAIMAYFSFHYVANLTPPQALTNGHALNSNFLSMTIVITFAKIFQYLIPAFFAIGAAASVFKSKHRGRLLEQQSGIESIRNMSWQNFELLVGEAFRRKGFEVKENGGGGADGGIDLILYKNGKKSIVQCKRWKTFSINVSLVRELYGVMSAESANECIFVSSGNYTSEARLFAENKPIWLIDGEELLKMVEDVQPSKNQPDLTQLETLKQQVPACPLCCSSMVKRTAKKGTNAGSEFWGCSKYPACRGTR